MNFALPKMARGQTGCRDAKRGWHRFTKGPLLDFDIFSDDLAFNVSHHVSARSGGPDHLVELRTEFVDILQLQRQVMRGLEALDTLGMAGEVATVKPELIGKKVLELGRDFERVHVNMKVAHTFVRDNVVIWILIISDRHQPK
jgi:hypothetical protein